jgi:hypothetical protein
MPHRFRKADRMESSQKGMSFHQCKNSPETDQVESRADKVQRQESQVSTVVEQNFMSEGNLVHKLLVVRSVHVVRKVDEKLSQTTLGSCVVT